MSSALESGGSPACLVCRSRAVEPWARARDVEYGTTDEEFAYVRCPACDVLCIHPVPSDRLDVIYPERYYSFTEGAGTNGGEPGAVERIKQALDRRRFGRLLARIPGESLRILDVGGGTGWLLDSIRGLDPRVRQTAVVDLNEAAGSVARARGHEFHCARIEDFEHGSRFDLVLLLNLIEHVADPAAVLAKVRELLAPRGLLLVKTPNYESLDARVLRHRHWGGYHCPRHWVLFTAPSFRRLAERTGLRVSRFAYTQGAPFWTVGALHALRRFGLARDRTKPLAEHPLYGPLAALFAALDFARMPFSKTSQMFFELEREGERDG